VIESRCGLDFPSFQTGHRAHPVSCKLGAGSYLGVKCGRGVLLTTHPLLVPRSRRVELYLYANSGPHRSCWIVSAGLGSKGVSLRKWTSCFPPSGAHCNGNTLPFYVCSLTQSATQGTHETLEKYTSNFSRKSESALLLERPRIIWDDNIKLDLTAVEYGNVIWTHGLNIRTIDWLLWICEWNFKLLQKWTTLTLRSTVCFSGRMCYDELVK